MMIPARSTQPARRWLGAAAVIVVAACGETTTTDVPVSVSSIDVNPSSLTITAGETGQLSAVPKSASGNSLTARGVQWSSAGAAVATVSPAGLVTGVNAGTTTITATSGSASKQVTVTVNARPHIALSSTSLSFTALTGAVAPAAQTVTVTNSLGNPLNGISLGTTQFGAGQPTGWVRTSIDRTSAPAVVSITVDQTGRTPGTYTATVPVLAPLADNSPVTISVTMVVQQASTITIQPGSLGSGTVTSSPAILNCSIASGGATGTCAAVFAAGTSVTLNAATRSGSQFIAWGGACLNANRFSNPDPPSCTLPITTATGASISVPAFFCTVTPIVFNQTLSGTLTSSGCPLGDGSFFDIYSFSVSTTTNVTVDVSSSQFSTFMFIKDSQGISQGSSTRVSTTPSVSRIAVTLSAGTYFIYANGISSTSFGSYTVFLR
jgi:hypothetical protein